MRESICVDWDWENYVSDRLPRTEDEWWDWHCEMQSKAEEQAHIDAVMSADLIEFEAEEEREAYIDEYEAERYEELLAEMSA